MSDERHDHGPAGCADGCATSGCGCGCLLSLIAMVVVGFVLRRGRGR